MDQQTSIHPAQSSIRSFFQPLLQTQPTKHNQPRSSAQSVQAQSIPSPPTSKSSSQTGTPIPSPPPVKSASSYAPPPNSNSKPQTSSLPRQTTNSSLPKDAAILPIHKDHITSLRRINSLLLPIGYPDSFYHAILAPSEPANTNFSRVITWEDKVIGGIVCRLDKSLPTVPSSRKGSSSSENSTSSTDATVDEEYDIYIQSLCLLSPYRQQGLIKAAFEDILLAAVIESKVSNIKIKGLYAHVWTSNEEALEWYQHRGFTIYEGGVVNGYYRRLKPDTAYILRRELKPSDHLLSTVHSKLSGSEIAPKVLASARDTTSSPAPPPPPANTPVPPLATGKLRPQAPIHSRSFQERGPEREWNDLPEDIVGGRTLAVMGGSAASSRSNSSTRLNDVGLKGKKKGRVYPAAAFSG